MKDLSNFNEYRGRRRRPSFLDDDYDEDEEGMDAEAYEAAAKVETGKAAPVEITAVNPAESAEFNVTFDDVFGYEQVKKVLYKMCDMAKDSEKYKEAGAKMPHGVLLFGRPGVGKTMIAKAFIRELNRPTYVIRKSVGGNEFLEAIGKAFSDAKASAPSVILLDDLDRYSAGKGYTPEFAAVQAGIDSVQQDDVMVIATVNDRTRLPDALCRSGRFDRKIEMTPPAISESPEIIARFLKGKKVSEDINSDVVAKLMDGYTCADLNSVLNDATLNSVYAGRSEIHMDDLVPAILAVVYGADETEEIPEEDKIETAYHEAGHAAAAALLRPGSVAIASVSLGRRATRGFVKTLSEERSTYQSIRNSVVQDLAGRAATEIKFSVKDTGCSKDLNDAQDAAAFLTGECCAAGIRYFRFGPRQDGDRDISEKNGEVIRIMEECYDEAKALLSRNWDLVERIAQGLIEKNTLICSDIDKIMADCSKQDSKDTLSGITSRARKAA